MEAVPSAPRSGSPRTPVVAVPARRGLGRLVHALIVVPCPMVVEWTPVESCARQKSMEAAATKKPGCASLDERADRRLV
jgi:hypothetical protein